MHEGSIASSPRSDYGNLRYSSMSERSEESYRSEEFYSMRVEPLVPDDRQDMEDKGEDWTNAVDHIAYSFQMNTELPAKSIRTAWIHDPRVRRLTDQSAQPVREFNNQRPLCIEVKINGVSAYTLLDSGCTTDSISPPCAYIAMADRVDLQEQVGLQLGARGSRTKICYGARAKLVVGTVQEPYYFDVVDIDRYDVILGTPFFRKHNVILDFKNQRVTIDGASVPIYTEVDEAEAMKARTEAHKKKLAQNISTIQKAYMDKNKMSQ